MHKPLTVLEKMIFGQSDEALGAGKALGHQETNSQCDLVPQFGRPGMDVLQQVGNRFSL